MVGRLFWEVWIWSWMTWWRPVAARALRAPCGPHQSRTVTFCWRRLGRMPDWWNAWPHVGVVAHRWPVGTATLWVACTWWFAALWCRAAGRLRQAVARKALELEQKPMLAALLLLSQRQVLRKPKQPLTLPPRLPPIHPLRLARHPKLSSKRNYLARHPPPNPCHPTVKKELP